VGMLFMALVSISGSVLYEFTIDDLIGEFVVRGRIHAVTR